MLLSHDVLAPAAHLYLHKFYLLGKFSLKCNLLIVETCLGGFLTDDFIKPSYDFDIVFEPFSENILFDREVLYTCVKDNRKLM